MSFLYIIKKILQMHRLLVKCYLRLEGMELVGTEKMKEERDLLFNRKSEVCKIKCHVQT